jgi:hypothetical protein
MPGKRLIVCVYGMLALLAIGAIVSDFLIGRAVANLAERRQAMLQARVKEFRAEGVTLVSSLKQLSESTGVPIVCDTDDLAAAAWSDDEPLYQLLFDVPLEQALELILPNLGREKIRLTWAWEDERLVVSTGKKSQGQMTLGVYDLSDIKVPEQDPNQPLSPMLFSTFANTGWLSPKEVYLMSVVDIITSTVAPETWRITGGSTGQITLSDDRIIVLQTQENQKMTDLLLKQLFEPFDPAANGAD